MHHHHGVVQIDLAALPDDPDLLRRMLREPGILVFTVLMPVATSSGEQLEHRVGDPGDHAHLGDQLIWFSIPLVVLSLALVWLDRRQGQTADVGSTGSVAARTSSVVKVVAVLALVSAVAASVQVYRVGDSGARAAWGDKVQRSR